MKKVSRMHGPYGDRYIIHVSTYRSMILAAAAVGVMWGFLIGVVLGVVA
jgi:hypothetical protein